MPARQTILCALLFIHFGLSDVASREADAHLDAALAAVRAEPKVRSADWLDPGFPSLLVGVTDDKTRRDGFASYLCLVLAEHGVRGGVVRVLDEGAAAARDEWRELGKAWCAQ